MYIFRDNDWKTERDGESIEEGMKRVKGRDTQTDGERERDRERERERGGGREGEREREMK